MNLQREPVIYSISLRRFPCELPKYEDEPIIPAKNDVVWEKCYPDLALSVPQLYIASYFRITPQLLSRIPKSTWR